MKTSIYKYYECFTSVLFKYKDESHWMFIASENYLNTEKLL